jgi:hypothetical protein
MSSNGHGGKPFVSGDPRAKQWKEGESGNPGGRPKGFTTLIRQETRSGAELVEFVVTVFRNGNLKQRQWATDWLADRGFGRPVQVNAIQLDQFGQICARLFEAARTTLSPEDYERVAAVWNDIAGQMRQEE